MEEFSFQLCVRRASRTAVFRRVARSLAVVACVLLLVVPAIVSASTTGSIYFASDAKLYRFDLAANQLAGATTLPRSEEPKALGVAADGRVWLLSGKALTLYGVGLSPEPVINLNGLFGSPDKAERMAVSPYGPNLWLAGKRTAVRIDDQGGWLSSWASPDDIRGIAYDVDEHLWVLTKRSLVRLSGSATVTHAVDLSAQLTDGNRIGLDVMGGQVWVSDARRMFAIRASEPTQLLRSVDVAATASAAGLAPAESAKIETLTVHPTFGTVYVTTRTHLLVFDRDGGFLRAVRLSEFGLSEAEAACFDPVNFNLVLAGGKSIALVEGSGTLVTRITAADEVEVVGLSAFKLSPSLVLIAPVDGTVTRNAFSPLRYRLGADCTGTPCVLSPGFYSGYRLGVDVNGQAVGSLFNINGDEATLNPATRWAEGVNRVTAQATDAYGHASSTVSSQFTIDTTPPSFASVSPPDGATVPSSAVTIQGSVNDSTASVMLLDATGGVLSIGSAQFAFSVLLRDGWNSFVLLARDAAGNEARYPVRLLLSGSSAVVTEPVAGATVSGDSIVVSGTFSGPENTGITVNGVAAAVWGNEFVVSGVSLSSGANTLTVVVTTPDGATSTRTVTVNSSGSSVLRVSTDPRTGIAPLRTRFRASLANGEQVSRVDVDADGNGSVDVSSSNSAIPPEFTYTIPGVYRPRVTAYDSQGRSYTQTLAIVAQDPQRADQMFRNIFAGMITRLQANNIEGALTAITGGVREKYRAVFTALGSNLATAASQIGALQSGRLGEEMAEYTLTRSQGVTNRAFLIYFLRSEDGVWRIDGM